MSKIRQKIWDTLRENKTQFLTASELANMAQTNLSTTSNYLNMLNKSGFVEVQKQFLKRYRLLKNVRQAPRLGRDGSMLPEPLYMVIWRTAKILKRFTVYDLYVAVSMTHDVKEKYVIYYLSYLVKQGFAARNGAYFVLKKFDNQAPAINWKVLK